MILGLSLSAFTTLHVFITLVALAAGAGLSWTLLRNHDSHAWAYTFFAGTFLTSATGFLFPATTVTPAQILGVLSFIGLALAMIAYRRLHRSRRSRVLYVVASVVIFYFNAFVTVVQSFQKIPALHALAPQGNEPPFAIAQGLVLLAFVGLGWVATRAFDPDKPHEEDLIDEALAESFPASDAPAVDPPHAR